MGPLFLHSFYKHNEPVINAAIFGPLKAEEHFLGQAIVVYFWAFKILHQSLLSKNTACPIVFFKVYPYVCFFISMFKSLNQ